MFNTFPVITIIENILVVYNLGNVLLLLFNEMINFPLFRCETLQNIFIYNCMYH